MKLLGKWWCLFKHHDRMWPINGYSRCRICLRCHRVAWDERGSDLVEYTLLLAFVALAAVALFVGSGAGVQAIWTTANSHLSAANAPAAGLAGGDR